MSVWKMACFTPEPEPASAPPPGDGWQPIDTAKTTGPVEWVDVWNGVAIVRAHFACDDSGEYQPAFRGWFFDAGSTFYAVTPPPTHWRAATP